jgi:hypothetical protein
VSDEPQAHGVSDEPQAHAVGRRRIEVASTLLLAIATVATAWAGYQAARWHGKQAIAQSQATAARVDATRLSGVAGRKGQVDVAVFIQWVDARAQSDTALATFYRRRFSDHLAPAFRAWIAMRPFDNANAALSPFELPQYVIPEARQAAALETKAKASADVARVDIEHADDYVLCVVLLASALFFAGLSTRLPTLRSEAVILGLGWAVLLGTAIYMATLPVSVSL